MKSFIDSNTLKEQKIQETNQQILDSKNFAKNEKFLPLVKDANLFLKAKEDIIAFLQTQNFDALISEKNISHMLWGISDVDAMKDKNNVFSRCSDEFDTIIKMYHLAVMSEQNAIAKSIQDKMIVALNAYLQKHCARYFSNHTLERIAKIALACNVYEMMKTALYNNGLMHIEKFLTNLPSSRECFKLLSTIDTLGLLDTALANKAKALLEIMTNSDYYYFEIVNLLNKSSPNLVTEDEMIHFVKSFLQKNSQGKRFMSFVENDSFVAGIMERPYLFNQPEIFSMLLFRIKPLDFECYAKIYSEKFYHYFESRQFDPWQIEIIQTAKKEAEAHFVKNNFDKMKALPVYTPKDAKDEKTSQFEGPQTIYVQLTLPRHGEYAYENFEITPELLTQHSTLFDSITNVLNASLNGKNGYNRQVGLSTSEAFTILNQHSYYKHTGGAVAAEVVVDGSRLDYYSEADVSFALNAGRKRFAVLKKDTVIPPENVIALHKLDILDNTLSKQFPKVLMNKESVAQKVERVASPNLFNKTTALITEEEKSVVNKTVGNKV